MKIAAVKGLAISLLCILAGCDSAAPDESNLQNISINASSAYAVLTSEQPQMVNEAQRELMPLASRNSSKNAPKETSSEASATNVFAIDEEGNLQALFGGSISIMASFTAVTPNKESIYIALKAPWHDGYIDYNDEDLTSIDFERVIIENNCALFVFTFSDNSLSCAAEGLYVKGMDDYYYQSMSSDSKPLQFDAEGNVYFTASPFKVEDYYLNFTDWDKSVYRLKPQTGNVQRLTQDNEDVQFFNALSTGEIVVSTYNYQNGNSTLKLFRETAVIELTSQSYGVNFFTADDYNTVIFSEGWGDGRAIRFAKPRINSFGVEMASIDSSTFESLETDKINVWNHPENILLSSNGRMYGIFTGNDHSENDNYLFVNQILPYQTEPLLTLNMGNQQLWDWIRRTNIQVQGDTLFYVEPIEVPFYGIAHTINMLDVNTLEETVLLTPSDVNYSGRYNISNWKIAGNELHFSALKLDDNSVTMGKIDIEAFEQGNPKDSYLSLTEVASATEAVNQIIDIEILKSNADSEDPYAAPTITLQQDKETDYALGLDFSVAMDKNAVESYLTLTSDNPLEGNAGNLDFLSVWINKSLHLIPDLDGLADTSETTPLTFGEAYQITLPADIDDVFGNKSVYFSEALDLRPKDGWYATKAGELKHVVTDFVSGDETVHNVFGEGSSFDSQSLPEHFELKFDVVETDYNPQLEFKLHDWGEASPYEFFDLTLNYSSNIRSTVRTNGSYSIQSTNSNNREGMTYRLRLFGTSFIVDKKPIGSDDTEYTVNSLFDRSGISERTGSDYRLSISSSANLTLDNLSIIELNEDGTNTIDGEKAELNFNSGELPESFEIDISDQL